MKTNGRGDDPGEWEGVIWGRALTRVALRALMGDGSEMARGVKSSAVLC